MHLRTADRVWGWRSETACWMLLFWRNKDASKAATPLLTSLVFIRSFILLSFQSLLG